MACVGALLCAWAPAALAVSELPKVLQQNVPLNDLAGAAQSEAVFRVTVPPGATNLRFFTSGGSGDCDLYARIGAHPTTSTFDQASTGLSAAESVLFTQPGEGVWYVLLHGYTIYRGVRLQVRYQSPAGSVPVPLFSPGPGIFSDSARVQLRTAAGARATIFYTTDGSEPSHQSPVYKAPIVLAQTTTIRAWAFYLNGSRSPMVEGTFVVEPGAPPIEIQSGVPVFHRAGNHGAFTYFKFFVPPGQELLRVNTSGGTGSSAILLNFAQPPVVGRSFRAANGPRNVAQIDVKKPSTGIWYIALRGMGNYSGVSVSMSASAKKPDLIVWGDSLKPYIADANYSAQDCEVIEGLIQAGPRRLLRFTTESRNVGDADLVLGSPVGNPAFEYAACHGHYHFKEFASYQLLDLAGRVVATGKKVSFCLEDVQRWSPLSKKERLFDCDSQGIQSGWADIYDSGLPGQWVDVTDIAPGNYELEVTINPAQILYEGDYQNNSTRIPVSIPPRNPAP